MTRGDFVKHIAGIFALGWLPAGNLKADAHSVELYQGWIAGYYYYDGPAVETALSPGLDLRLHREPGNKHDDKAIEIYAGPYKLGYIPRKDNKILAKLMDQHVLLEAKVLDVYPEAPYEESVRIEVKMEKEMNPPGFLKPEGFKDRP